MEKTTDDQVAVTLIETALAGFPTISSASFDKGFHSPANQIALAALIPQVVMPKKGKLSQAQREREAAPEFVRLRRQHSAVESAINALEVHGLDRCLDHGIDGFQALCRAGGGGAQHSAPRGHPASAGGGATAWSLSPRGLSTTEGGGLRSSRDRYACRLAIMRAVLIDSRQSLIIVHTPMTSPPIAWRRGIADALKTEFSSGTN